MICREVFTGVHICHGVGIKKYHLHLFLSRHIVYVNLLSLDHDREINDRNLRKKKQLMDLIDRYS